MVPSYSSLTQRAIAQIISSTKACLKKSTPDDHGIVYSSGPGTLVVRVSPAQIERALLVGRNLLDALASRRIGIDLSTERGSPTCIQIENITLEIVIREGWRQAPHVPTEEEKRAERLRGYALHRSLDYHPTGELSLVVTSLGLYGAHNRWSDGKRHGPLEEQTDRVVAGLIHAASVMKALEEKRQRENEERHAAYVRAEERRRMIEAERLQADALVAETGRWRQAQQIRDYVEAIRRSLSSAANAEPTRTSGLGWITKALAVADRLDPLPARVRAFTASPEPPADDGRQSKAINSGPSS